MVSVIVGYALSVLDGVAILLELFGIFILLSSGLLALSRWLTSGMPRFATGDAPQVRELRTEYGQQIVFALEFFISADLIKSIQVPTFAELAKLGIIVIIRTVLHYSLS